MEHLIPWIVLLPLAWAGLAFLVGPAWGARLSIAGVGAQLALALAIAAQILASGVQHHAAGGWGAPLGIDLAADGLSAIMLLLTQIVGLPLMFYARAYFAGSSGSRHFWPLAGFLFAGIHALVLAADLFNLYVALELIGLAAVSLVALGGGPAQLAAALRYLFATLLGSGAYLLGVALLYGTYGSVSLATLVPLIDGQPPLAVWLAAAAMLAGLMLKTALFPFHFWLPPAHGGAPAPVSALLSALVVKASFYLILRLWIGPLAPLATAIAWFPALLGVGAILWGSFQAIRAERLKVLVAYSTVAQLGYLFLIFPLLAADGLAFQAGALQMVSHGLAKAAMFAAAGVLIAATGEDSVAAVAGAAERLPVTLFAFGLAGVTLMGLPPSGGFLAKWLLIDAALTQGYWPLAAVAIAGGLLAAVYVLRVLRYAFLAAPAAAAIRPVSRMLEWSAFVLALMALALGLRAVDVLDLLRVGSAP